MPGGAGHNRGNSQQNFATPRIFGAAVLQRLNIDQFAHDFAASSENAVANCYWDEELNSLSRTPERWRMALTAPDIENAWGWLNPPFDKIAPWAKACAALKETAGQIAFLVPAAVGSNWWHDYVHGRALVLFLNGRIPFDPKKPHWGYPKDLALCLYSATCEPSYEIWEWLFDVPTDLMAEHKQRCTEARAAEAAARKTTQ